MKRESVTVDEVIAILNEALKLDPDWISSLMQFRPLCNKAIAYHPYIQVGINQEKFEAGFLGLLNGFFGQTDDGWGQIAMEIDNFKVVKFRRLEKEP